MVAFRWAASFSKRLPRLNSLHMGDNRFAIKLKMMFFLLYHYAHVSRIVIGACSSLPVDSINKGTEATCKS
jgi:hypothetical protein